MDRGRVSDGGIEFFPELVGAGPAAYLDCPNRLEMSIRIRRFLAKQYSDIELNKKEYLAKRAQGCLKARWR